MSNLKVSTTAYPNGEVVSYQNGMPNTGLLPSNHPDVIAMKHKRTVSKPRKAAIVIDMSSRKLKQIK